MKKLLPALAVALACLAVTAPASAGPATDAMTTCLADNSTGKDRKDLARWIFVGIAAHPEIRELSSISQATRERMDQRVADIVTRLLTENCPEQARLALDSEGAAAFEAAFGSVGRLAMQELMSNKEVNTAFGAYEKYLDKAKFEAAFPGGASK